MARQRTVVKPVRPEPEAWDRLRDMFDDWSERGTASGMKDSHMHLALAITAELPASKDDVILDLSCGAGWFTRHLASEIVPEGQVVGVDISEKMVQEARENAENPKNVRFEVATAEELPLEEGLFDHVVNIESFYYYPDQVAAGHEIFRVLKPGGTFFVAMNFYLENRFTHHWREHIDANMHCKGADQYNTLFRACGFIDVGDQRIRGGTDAHGEVDGKWIRTQDQLEGFTNEGALLISGRKPPGEA